MESETRPDHVYHRIVDELVDSCLPPLDKLNDTIDELKHQALNSPTPEVLSTIFLTKRTLIFLRGVLVNTRDLAGQLHVSNAAGSATNWGHFSGIFTVTPPGTWIWWRSCGTCLPDRWTFISRAWPLGTLALPSLVVSGIYGMNVKGMPGADSPKYWESRSPLWR